MEGENEQIREAVDYKYNKTSFPSDIGNPYINSNEMSNHILSRNRKYLEKTYWLNSLNFVSLAYSTSMDKFLNLAFHPHPVKISGDLKESYLISFMVLVVKHY